MLQIELTGFFVSKDGAKVSQLLHYILAFQVKEYRLILGV